MNYTILTTGMVKNSDGLTFPQVSENAEYQAYLAWIAAGNTASVETAPTQTSVQARALGEAYVEQFFTLMQMMEFMELLQSSSTPPDQLAKIQAVYNWLNAIKAAWLANPTTFNPATFGNPPYTYGDIASTIN